MALAVAGEPAVSALVVTVEPSVFVVAEQEVLIGLAARSSVVDALGIPVSTVANGVAVGAVGVAAEAEPAVQCAENLAPAGDDADGGVFVEGNSDVETEFAWGEIKRYADYDRSFADCGRHRIERDCFDRGSAVDTVMEVALMVSYGPLNGAQE